jgi:hypothetical protein
MTSQTSTPPTQPPAFPAVRAVAATLASGVVMVALAVLINPLLPGVSADAGLQAAVTLGGVVVVGGLVSVVLVARMAHRGPQAVAQAFFMGMILRMAAALAALAGAVLVGELPKTALLLTLAMTYPPLLAVEVAYLVRYLRATGTGPKGPDRTQSPAPNSGTEALA